MKKLPCVLGIALLLTTGSGTLANEPSTVTKAQTPDSVTPPPAAPAAAGSAPAPAAGQAKAAGKPETGPASAKSAGQTETGTAAAAASPKATPEVVSIDDPTVRKLKAQIKTVRLSLAETSGRLAVTERNLDTTNGDVSRLRMENTSLQAKLAKAEASSAKVEEELAARRQEIRGFGQQLTASGKGGTGTAGVVLVTAAILLLALAVLSQGRKLRTILARLPDGKADDRRHEQLRAQLKDEQQKAQRLDEECKRLREAANKAPTPGAGGSKRDKHEQLRRELRDARAAAEAERAAAGERIAALETEIGRLLAENQRLDDGLTKANEKLIFFGHDDSVEGKSAAAD